MSPETPSQKTQVCPTCGTRLSESATRCLVCGTELTPRAAARRKKAERAVQAGRIPEITLSLPAALGFLALFLIVGAVVVYFALSAGGRVISPTPIPSPTETVTITPTPTATLTPTLVPTPTPLPPFDYTVHAGETCGGLALRFGVSTNSIIILNNLDAECRTLRENQVIKIPYPTATPLPPPTSTLEPSQATKAACETASYTVQENDTPSGIAANYAVPWAAIKEYNGLAVDQVNLGQTLIIPLCMRAATPGPTPTATIPPPYLAPNLLLPADGSAFTLANDVVTLQWASIGTLRENEAYRVVIEDVTADQGRRFLDYVTDTKYIVPTSFRPKDSLAHVMRWWIEPVRQTGTDEQGQPIWTSAGAISEKRVFTWVGATVPGTPAP